ncbi:hypothetical protein J3F83DRAFT_754789 [Trichoderma novae-zelandiae]
MLETNKIYLRIILVACLATTVTASWWDDFTNNLATDLTPLIALFGEQATKQFLSESTTILDNFIFAMAPLGILTGVVSAIRVCGGPSLRAFIGRAQEGGGIAEAELCSSTSRDVCELYHNGAIVRVFGRPKILEIIYDPVLEANEAGEEDKHKFGISISREYFQQSILNDKRWQEKGLEDSDDEAKNSLSSATNSSSDFAPNPNLSLNIGIVKRSAYVYNTAATFGFLAQSSVIVLAAVVKYKLKWKKNESLIDPWAFPFALMGTVSICFGMFLCATLVNDSTKERVFEQKVKTNGRTASPGPMLYVVQPGNQVVGDQTFDPFLFSKITHSYMTSWKAPSASDPSSGPQVPTGRKSAFGFKDLRRPSEEVSVLIATLITTLGFALQFVGLRAMHSIVSLLQLAVTILMSVIRALLRTQRLSIEANVLRDRPDEVSSHELDWLALQIGRRADEPRCFWTVVPEVPTQGPEVPLRTDYSKAWEYRFRLAELTGQSANAKTKLSNAWGNDLVSGRLQAQQLKKAIEDSISLFIAHAKPRNGSRGAKYVPWSLNVAVGDVGTRSHQTSTYRSINVPLRKQDSRWTVDQNLLEAIIGLWSWSIISDPRTEGETFGFRTSSASDIPVYRAIAAGTQTETEQAWREIQFWIGSPNLTLSSMAKGTQSSPGPRTNATTIWRQGSPMEDDDSHPVPNLGVSGLYQRLFGWHGINNSNGPAIGAIRLNSNHIPTLCAQDIYQSFLCAVAALFDLDNEATTVTREENAMRLEHQLITKLTECFGASGLGSKQDASLVIIPALQNSSVLPRAAKAVPTAYRIAGDLRKGGSFREAEGVLQWAWGVNSELGEPQDTAMTELGELYRYALFSEDWHAFGKEGLRWMISKRNPSVSSDSVNEVVDRYVALEKRPRESRTGQDVLDAVLRREREDALWSISQLEKGGDLPSDANSGRTLLSLLSEEGWFELVQAVLEIGSSVDSVDNRGRTPLSYAAERGHLPVVSILMRESALPVIEDSSQRSPLSYAAGEGHVRVVEKLLSDPRVNVYTKDVQNRTPLHWAAINGHDDAIRYLVEQGARVNDVDNSGQTPLLAALLNNRRRKTDRKRTADLLVRLKSKVDLLIQDEEALDWALTNGEFTCAEYLLEHHEDGRDIAIVVDFSTSFGYSHLPTLEFQPGFHVRFFDEEHEANEPTMRDILEIAEGRCYMAITYVTNGLPNRSITCRRPFHVIWTLFDGPQEVGTIEDLIEAAAQNEDGLEFISVLLETCETQSQTRIQITDKAIEAMAYNNKGKDIMILLLTQRERNIHITEATVSAIARYFDEDVMALLLDRHGAKSLITEDSVNAAASNENAGREVMALLLDQGGAQVLITEETMKMAAASTNSLELIELLLDRRGDQVQITEELLKAAAAIKRPYGLEVFKLLLDRQGDQVQITEEVLKAAAAGSCGREKVELLLDRQGDQVQITEGVLKAAAANRYSQGVLKLLLDQQGDQVQVTEEVLKAAAAGFHTQETFELLLDRRGDQVQITEGVLGAAARNPFGQGILKLLLDRQGNQV